MSSPKINTLSRLGVCGLFALSVGAASAGSAYVRQGSDYPVTRLQYGDQILASISTGNTGGYLVWQDNATDGEGLGISAQRLQGNLLSDLGVFRVNEGGTGDQQNAKVKLFKEGGAVFVWQGGVLGEQDVFARFVAPDGTFLTGDVRVNSYMPNQQGDPVVTVLEGGDVVFAWSSFGQDGNMQGIFAQRFSSTGEKVGTEFQINQFSPYNQRTPAIEALQGGGFAAVWVSEQQRFENSIDLFARVFPKDIDGVGNEFLINTTKNICANPTVAPLENGGFMIGWGERDISELNNGWNVFARSFDANAQALGSAVRLNTDLEGQHYAPKIASLNGDHMVVWTSDRQDGSQEGVFGRFVASTAEPISEEIQINTFTANKQIYPTVTSDGAGQFLVVWSSFIGGPTSFDLFAQRFAPSAVVPEAPFAAAISPSKLSVTWPLAQDGTVQGYEVYVDNNPTPTYLDSNIFSLGSLAPSSTHTFKLAFRFKDGTRSPLSASVSIKTWGSDDNLDGLPDDWQQLHWNVNASKWPDSRSDSDNDGASNLDEFLAGTDPKVSTSVLRMTLRATLQGSFLDWNTRPGFIYQVQSKSGVESDWQDIGDPRFAGSETDSMRIGYSEFSKYYRVKRLR